MTQLCPAFRIEIGTRDLFLFFDDSLLKWTGCRRGSLVYILKKSNTRFSCKRAVFQNWDNAIAQWHFILKRTGLSRVQTWQTWAEFILLLPPPLPPPLLPPLPLLLPPPLLPLLPPIMVISRKTFNSMNKPGPQTTLPSCVLHCKCKAEQGPLA